MTARAKTPAEVKDFGLDWSNELLFGDQIATSAWAVPAGITQVLTSVNGSSVTLDGRTVLPNRLTAVLLSGGTAGTDYECVNTITTTGGLTLSRRSVRAT